MVPVNLHKTEAVEPAVNGPQGAQVLAEGAEHLHGKQDDHQQDAQLPEEQPAGLASQGFIGAQQGKRPQQGPGGAKILAEGRDLGKASEQEHGTNAHQQNQHRILSVFQDAVAGQALPFLEEGNLMEKVLHQPEGAQPAADEAPQHASEHKENPQGGEGDLKAPLVQQGL